MAILGLIALLAFLFVILPAFFMLLGVGPRGTWDYYTKPQKKSDHVPDPHYSDWGM